MAQEKDPVCGMMIDDKTAAATSEFQGRRYYFCSEGCKTSFEKNPAEYTRKA